MKKTLILAVAFLGMAMTMRAQQQIPKLDGALSRMVQQSRAAGPAAKARGEERVTVIVRCRDAEAVSRLLAQDGTEVRIILPTLLTANVPLRLLSSLAECEVVESITRPTKYRPLMTEARAVSGVDDLHRGEGLETPFTGRGVVLGVIDQGFEYRHPAFLDHEGNSRVRAVWNRTESSDTAPIYDIPAEGDKGGGGHATHVTNIAAGTDTGNHLHGVAPDAEIVMIPSSFDDYEVLEDVKWIKEQAEKEGKPWVVNMSFGTTVGPHDGTGGCCAEISQLTGRGGIIVAAMGNEGGEALHISAELQPGDTKYVLCKGGDDGALLVDFWAADADDQRHFVVQPITYANYKVNEQNAEFWHDAMPDDLLNGSYEEIDVKNHKQHGQYIFDMYALTRALNTSYSSSKSIVGFKIQLSEGETEAHTFHAWTGQGHGTFSPVSINGQKSNMIVADCRYLAAEGSACIPSSIAVAAYNSNVKFTALPDGAMYDYSRFVGPEGGISTFSNAGPWLGEGLPKPLLSAPGSVIKSAVSKLVDGFMLNDPTLVDKITDAEGNDFYYSAMQGTSMASPFVAGAVCLWLEANPQLSPLDVAEIIRQTTTVDDSFASEYETDAAGIRSEWSPRAGYGRIDVYNGLKMALSKGNLVGIPHMDNSCQPFTLRKNADSWDVLFNSDVHEADFRIFSTDGRLVRHSRVDAATQGEDYSLSFSGLKPGTYLIQLTTSRCTLTRRVLIK